MNIKPIDVLNMLDDEDLAEMSIRDLNKLCIAITLDEQIKAEDDQSSSNWRDLC